MICFLVEVDKITEKSTLRPFAGNYQYFSLILWQNKEKAMAPHSHALAWKIPWRHEELDTTERLHFHFSLSCIGEGNGNPLQCSCRENPWDGGAWWAAVSGVAQSGTWLKRPSSSSRTRLWFLKKVSSSMNLKPCNFKDLETVESMVAEFFQNSNLFKES